MKIKKLLVYTFILFFACFKVIAEEVEFEASKLDIKDDGNIIFAYNSKTLIPSEKVKITSDKARYNKNTEIILFTKNVIFKDLINNIVIKGSKVTYNKDKNLIYSEGNTIIDVEDKYNIKSRDIYFNRNSNEIFSDKKTIIEDNKKNIYKLDKKFLFNINQELIRSEKSIIIDKEQNKYIFVIWLIL